MPELHEDMVISNSLGMHLRPAQKLVQTVLKFQCDVHILKDGQRVNAKSIMGLLTLAAAQGTRLEVVCDGDDAQEALDAVRKLIDSGFGEQ
jgi:phosphocarrier protein